MEKFSRKREAIYEAICSTKSHPNAEWVYESVRRQYPDVSLGTVYRNISRFKEEGRVVPVAVVNGQERIDGDVSDHAHFVCERCGAVIDVQGPELTEAYEAVRRASGCAPTRHSLVFYGVCAACRSRQS